MHIRVPQFSWRLTLYFSLQEIHYEVYCLLQVRHLVAADPLLGPHRENLVKSF